MIQDLLASPSEYDTPTLVAFIGVPMILDPTQQHAGLQHSIFPLHQEVTRPEARFKPKYFALEFWGGWGEQSVANIINILRS